MCPLSPLLTFRARTVSGSGRGKTLGVPTINLLLEDVPEQFNEGIYACVVRGAKIQGPGVKDETPIAGALHYGPRPVFKDTVACEVHLLDVEVQDMPESVEIEILKKLRDVEDFASPEALKAQIAHDIAQTRAIVGP